MKSNVIITCDTTRALKSKIFIDDTERGKIGHGEYKSISLSAGTHTIYFRNCGSKTKKFIFEVGDKPIGIHLRMILRTSITLFEPTEKDILKATGFNSNSNSGIKLVKILGTRVGMETRVFATYNFTIYSMLVVYKNGERDVIECDSNSKRFKELIKYIDIGTTAKQSDPLSVDEMIEFDEMED